MADITNKNELKRRIELFLDELDYSINEDFCKETMKMMREFIGHANHRLDCEESRVKSLKKKLKEYNGGWIPCSERLPKECIEVLVSIKEIDDSFYTSTSWVQDGVWVIKKTPLQPTVIAWQPLPKPYKESD